MTDQTPSPQSVVVPVEPLTEMRAAAGYLRNAKIDLETGAPKATAIRTIEGGLKRLEGAIDAFADDGKAITESAPAPSSLAGGEVLRVVPDRVLTEALYWMARGYERVHSMPRVSDTELANKIEAAKADLGRARDASPVIAVLSPEAPAREGVVKACADFQEAIDYFEADVADALTEGSERADLWDREVTVNIDALKTVMSAALTPRHEAPACEMCNGRGEVGGPTGQTPESFEYVTERCPDCGGTGKHEAPAEGAGDFGDALLALFYRHGLKVALDVSEIEALRQSALRARSSAPEAREEALGNLLAVIHGDGGHRALEVGTKQAALEAEKIVAGLFAAPSADKLRIAVESIWEIAGGRATDGHNEAGRLERIKDRAAEILAALKAEGC